MKTCRTCKHYTVVPLISAATYEAYKYEAVCRLLTGKDNPIMGGEIEHVKCELMRINDDLCGWQGHKWEKAK